MFQTFSPNRGSVAFWWSLDRKGHRLQETLHGGCPILKGSKWIFNKWVHYFDQWKKFPCGLRTESTFDPPLLHYWIKLTLRGKKLPSNPQCWICLKIIIRQSQKCALPSFAWRFKLDFSQFCLGIVHPQLNSAAHNSAFHSFVHHTSDLTQFFHQKL
jgi:hypothetical protein